MLESTQGVSFSFFVCHGIFALLNLSLSVAALAGATLSDRAVKRQSVFIYTMWTSVLALHASIAFMKMPVLWKPIDTVAVSVVGVGVTLILAAATHKKMPLLDPYVKAGLAIFFKAVPQVALAITIYQNGKGGLSGWWILLGHVTILTRITHLWFSNRQKWDRNTKGSFVSEVWNEASWALATAAWVAF